MRWRKIAGHGLNGSWQSGLVRAVRPMVSDGSFLLAGTYGEEPGSAAVWLFDGHEWRTIYTASDHQHSFNRLNAFLLMGRRLIAGVGLWTQRGSAALLVIDDYDSDAPRVSLRSVPDNEAEAVDSLVWHNDRLYVGLGGNEHHPPYALLSLANGNWRTETVSRGLAGIYCMMSSGDALYLAGYRRTDRCALFRIRSDREECLATFSIHPDYRYGDPKSTVRPKTIIESLTHHDGCVYATLSHHLGIAPFETDCLDSSLGAGSVWRLTREGKWERVLDPKEERILHHSTNFNSAISFDGDFLFSSGKCFQLSPDLAPVRVWRVVGNQASPLAGGGINGSWLDENLRQANARGAVWIYSMAEHAGALTVSLAFGNGGGQAEIWTRAARPEDAMNIPSEQGT